MLGDELKKALEPIQASDELLEKTRRAIEEARLKQASETLAEKEAPRKNTARRSMFIRAVVPVACLLILGFGIYFLIPKGGKKDMKSKSSGGRSAAKEHNDAVGQIVDIDGELSFNTTESRISLETEATEEAEDRYEGQDVYEETESPTSDWKLPTSAEETSYQEIDGSSSSHYALKPDTENDYISDYGTHPSINVGDYILAVTEEQNALMLLDTSSLKELSDSDEHSAPKLDLEEGEKIVGLLYEKTTGKLCITTERPGKDANSDPELQIYFCIFKDGKVEGDQPTKVD